MAPPSQQINPKLPCPLKQGFHAASTVCNLAIEFNLIVTTTTTKLKFKLFQIHLSSNDNNNNTNNKQYISSNYGNDKINRDML